MPLSLRIRENYGDAAGVDEEGPLVAAPAADVAQDVVELPHADPAAAARALRVAAHPSERLLLLRRAEDETQQPR